MSTAVEEVPRTRHGGPHVRAGAHRGPQLPHEGAHHGHTFDYHDGPAADLLGKAAPGGIDVFVDNVGGDHLAAAVGALRDFGRIVRVGMISQYNAPDATPSRFNYADIVEKSIRRKVSGQQLP